MMRNRAFKLASWAVLALIAASTAVHAAQPLDVPDQDQVYSAPMATIQGRGAVPFRITLGMLVTRDWAPVGLYRSYPSSSPVPLSEQYGLGMLGTTEGVILASYGKVPLLALHGHIDSAPGTYALTVSYLTGLASRRYGRCTLHVARTPQGRWETVDAAGHRVTSFVVESRSFGISSITPCD